MADKNSEYDRATLEICRDVFDHLNKEGIQAPKLVINPDGGKDFETCPEGESFDPNDLEYMKALGRGAAKLEHAMDTLPPMLSARIDGDLQFKQQSIADLIGREDGGLLGENTKVDLGDEDREIYFELMRIEDRNRPVKAGIKYALDIDNFENIEVMAPLLGAKSFAISASKLQGDYACLGDLEADDVLITSEGELAVAGVCSMEKLPMSADLGMMALNIAFDGRPDATADDDVAVLEAIVEGYNEVASKEGLPIDFEDICDLIKTAATYKALNALGMVAKGVSGAEEAFKKAGEEYVQTVFRADDAKWCFSGYDLDGFNGAPSSRCDGCEPV